ncbi:MAG TPA: class F sortase [Chloroflexia bacterium]|nr:class F sortase [Chloroflexia bacterium]
MVICAGLFSIFFFLLSGVPQPSPAQASAAIQAAATTTTVAVNTTTAPGTPTGALLTQTQTLPAGSVELELSAGGETVTAASTEAATLTSPNGEGPFSTASPAGSAAGGYPPTQVSDSSVTPIVNDEAQAQAPVAGASGTASSNAGTGTGAGSGAGVVKPQVGAIPQSLTIQALGITNTQVKPVSKDLVKQKDGSRVEQWQALDYGVGYQPTADGQVCKWGLTVLNSHNWYRRKPGVFVNLYKLKPGDLIEVTDSAGIKCSYQVESSRQYPPLDSSWLYNRQFIEDLTTSHLVLYTCTEDFQERQVIQAVLRTGQAS